jgi:hypothetical protein
LEISAPEDAGRVFMNLFEQSFEISARLDQFIFVPFRVSIGPEQNPFPGFGLEPELSDSDFHPGSRFRKRRTFFVKRYAVSPELESEPEFIVKIDRESFTAVLGEYSLDLLFREFR